jgi:hypothetical protein
MGRYGSGQRSNRWTTDDCLHINLSTLKQLGMLQRHCMNRRERVIFPLLGGPKSMLFGTRKEKTNAIQETHAGGACRQAA